MFQLSHEFLDVFEIQIHRRKSNVSDFVEFFQTVNDQFADFAGLALARIHYFIVDETAKRTFHGEKGESHCNSQKSACCTQRVMQTAVILSEGGTHAHSPAWETRVEGYWFDFHYSGDIHRLI